MNAFLSTIESLFHTVVTLSAKGALLAVITGAVLLIVSKKMSSAWRHGLWMLVFLRLMLPDVAASRWAMTGWLPKVEAVTPIAVEAVALPVDAEPAEESPVVELASDPTPSPAKAAVAATSITKTQAPAPTLTLWQQLSIAWFVGVVFVLSLMVVLHVRMWRRVRRDRQGATDEMLRVLRQCCTLMGVKRVPELVITQAVQAPAVFGLVRPSVLLPADLEVDTASLRLVLLHELAHLRRRDLWVQVTAALAVAVHWFNPLAWWAHRRLRAEAELAADACVLRLTEKAEAHRFGEVLLSFASRAAAGWALWFSAATMLSIAEGRHDLRRRIDAIVDFSRGRRAWWIVGLMAFVMLAVTGLTQAPAEEVKETTEGKKDSTPPAQTTIKGEVVDAQGRAVAGASCLLSYKQGKQSVSLEVLSNDQGAFQFEPIPKGQEVKLWANHLGHVDSRPITFSPAEAESSGHGLVLAEPTAWVSGVVTDERDGKPVAGALLSMGLDLPPLSKDMQLQFARKAGTTDAEGRYQIARNYLGKLRKEQLIVDAPGMALQFTSLEWKDGQQTLNVKLHPEPPITGTVIDAQGKPVAGAVLNLVAGLTFLDTWPPEPSPRVRLQSHYPHFGYRRSWCGPPTTDEQGRFFGKLVDPDQREKLSIVVQHPTAGVQRMRLSALKPDGTIQLDAWNTVHGQVLSADGKPLAGAKVTFDEHSFQRDNTGKSAISWMHRSETTADSEGRYRLDHVLPRTDDSRISINGKSIGHRGFPLRAGETREFTIRLRPPSESVKALQLQVPQLPQALLQRVAMRVKAPAGKSLKSPDYDIHVGIRGENGVGYFPGDDPLDEQGRYVSRLLEPGRYRMETWVMRKGSDLRPANSEGLRMLFTIKPGGGKEPLDLGDFELGPEEFQFREPAKQPAAKPEKTQWQPLRATIEGDHTWVSWSASAGTELAPEKPFASDGSITGRVPLNAAKRFVLRATRQDGTHWFSTTQVVDREPDQTFETKLSLTPGITVEGKVTDLPSGYSGNGWISAGVWVSAAIPERTIVHGDIPTLVWYAWAPVKPDGSFRLPSLPRGTVMLDGFGDGWNTTDATRSSSTTQLKPSEDQTHFTLTIPSQWTLAQQVRFLRPDGSPASGAQCSVRYTYTSGLDRAFGRWGHDFDPANEEAYHNYKSAAVPGHSGTADQDGKVTFRNHLHRPYGTTRYEVKWRDADSTTEHVETVEVNNRSVEDWRTVTLKGKQP